MFAYLRLLADAPTPTLAATFDECAQLASLSFQFAEKSSSPADDASDLASQLSGPWPKDWTLSQQYLMRSFNADQIRSVIDRLADVGQVKGMVAGQKLPKSMEDKTWDCKEKVYGTEYRVDRFSEELVNAVRSSPSQLSSRAQNADNVHRPTLYRPRRDPYRRSSLCPCRTTSSPKTSTSR